MSEISLIMPVYNAEKYLSKALESILRQTFQNFELICIDDGSTDDSRQILSLYADKDERIKVVFQENKGAGATRNDGISYAKSKYIIFLDADDWFESEMLELAYKKISEKDADIVLFAYNMYRENKKADKQFKTCLYDNKIFPSDCFSGVEFAKHVFDISPAPWNKMYRRDFIIKNNLIFANLASCNDLTFSYSSLAIAKKITFVNQPLVTYRVFNPDSISAKRSKNTVCIIDAINLLKDYLKKNYLFDFFEDSYKLFSLKYLSFEYKKCSDLLMADNFVCMVKKLFPEIYTVFLINNCFKLILNSVYKFIK